MANSRTKKKSTSPTPPAFRSILRNLNEDNAEHLLSKPVLLISTHSKHHEAERLKATVVSLNNASNITEKFKYIDILIAGTLQRHNFWIYSEKLSDKEFRQLLKDIPEGINLEDLAALLASKFFPHAKKAESDYIRTNLNIYSSNLPDLLYNFISWEQMVPGISPNSVNTDKGNYKEYYVEVKKKYMEDPVFATAFKISSERVLDAKKNLIRAQGNRIRKLCPALKHLTDNDLSALAEICCRNFLLEECPLLFASMVDLGYKSVLYPSGLTEAFKVSQDLFSPSKEMGWITIYLHEIGGGNKNKFSGDSTEATVETSARRIGPLSRALSASNCLTIETKPTLAPSSFSAPAKIATETSKKKPLSNSGSDEFKHSQLRSQRSDLNSRNKEINTAATEPETPSSDDCITPVVTGSPPLQPVRSFPQHIPSIREIPTSASESRQMPTSHSLPGYSAHSVLSARAVSPTSSKGYGSQFSGTGSLYDPLRQVTRNGTLKDEERKEAEEPVIHTENNTYAAKFSRS